jgi:hypothetical protein
MRCTAAAAALGVLLWAVPGWGQTVIRSADKGVHVWCPTGGAESAIATAGGFYSWIRVGDPRREEGTWISIGNGCYARPMSSLTRSELINLVRHYCLVVMRNCYRNP